MTAEIITQAQLGEWRKLAEKATEGEWKVEPPDPSKKRRKPSRFIECVLTEGTFAGLKAVIAQAVNPHDRDFIAASRTAVPALVAEVERLRSALRKIDARRYGDRRTVTPDTAWKAFQKANAELCAIYDEAAAALTTTPEG